jgi:hypothetical protein
MTLHPTTRDSLRTALVFYDAHREDTALARRFLLAIDTAVAELALREGDWMVEDALEWLGSRAPPR